MFAPMFAHPPFPASRTLLGLVLAAFCGCGGGNVPAPTSYAVYENKDSEFKCEYPADWEAKGGGKKNHYAKFTKGSAVIDVKTDLTGSIMGDIAASSGAGKDPTQLTEADAPVHKIHLKSAAEMQETYTDYKEQPPVKFQCALGDARKSEFTAAGGFGGSLHGYRATIMGRDKRFRVTCTCPESNWATLQPAFDKVLESFGHGPGG